MGPKKRVSINLSEYSTEAAVAFTMSNLIAKTF